MGDPIPNSPATPVAETPPTPDPEKEQLVRLNAEQAQALALAQARLDFPKADAELLKTFQGTPEALRSFAEKLHAHELARETLPPPSSTPAPTPGPGNSTTAEDQWRARYNELRTKVLVYRNAEAWERDEFSNMAFADSWNKHQADRKLGRTTSA